MPPSLLPSIGLSVGVVNGLLSRCMDEINEMGTKSNGKSDQKRIIGPIAYGSESSDDSFDLQAILTSLASSLREVVEGNYRCACTFAKKSNADNVQKRPLL